MRRSAHMSAARGAAIMRRPLCHADRHLAVAALHDRQRDLHPPAHPRPHGAVRTPLVLDPLFAEEVDHDQAQATAGEPAVEHREEFVVGDSAAASLYTAATIGFRGLRPPFASPSMNTWQAAAARWLNAAATAAGHEREGQGKVPWTCPLASSPADSVNHES